MNHGDHQGLPYATAGALLLLLAGVNGTSASLSRRLLPPRTDVSKGLSLGHVRIGPA